MVVVVVVVRGWQVGDLLAVRVLAKSFWVGVVEIWKRSVLWFSRDVVDM